MNTVSNKSISEYLSKQEISHSHRGYQYLMLCLRAILDGKVDRSRVQSIYERVAEEGGLTAAQVERGIRHAIRKTSHPVSNKEFLLRAADDLALNADANAFIFEAVKPENTGPTTDTNRGL